MLREGMARGRLVKRRAVQAQVSRRGQISFAVPVVPSAPSHVVSCGKAKRPHAAREGIWPRQVGQEEGCPSAGVEGPKFFRRPVVPSGRHMLCRVGMKSRMLREGHGQGGRLVKRRAVQA